jgi:MFS family permease
MTAILSVSLLNAAATFGMIFTGLLVDRFHISTVLFISAIGSAMSVFLLWGFAVKELVLYAFAIAYGIFAGGYTATWSGSGVQVRKEYPEAEVAVIMGVLAAGRGFGCILSGPLSEVLLRISKKPIGLDFAYGTQFRSLIVFTGITMLLGRFGLVGSFRTRAKHGKSPNSRSEEDRLLGD